MRADFMLVETSEIPDLQGRAGKGDVRMSVKDGYAPDSECGQGTANVCVVLKR